jgi:HD superfamily phosphodiesterase
MSRPRWSYKTGDATDHARHSAREAQIILTDLACFTQEEIDEICEAIAQHSAKDEPGDEMSELI